MQQKSLKNRLVLLILFIVPITNFLSIYRFYTGRVLLGIVRIILFITFFATEHNENIMALSLFAWMIITVIDFILIVFGKFKDKKKLPISSFNPKKDYEKFLAEKRIEEESKKKSEESVKKITEQKITGITESAAEEMKEDVKQEVIKEVKEDVNQEAKKESIKEEIKTKVEEEEEKRIEKEKAEEAERIRKEKEEERQREEKEKAERKRLEREKLHEAKITAIRNLKNERNQKIQKQEGDFSMFNSRFGHLADNPFLQ